MKTNILKTFSIASVAALLWSGVTQATYAVGSINDLLGESPIGSPGMIPGIIKAIFQAAFTIAGIATLAMIIYGGYLFVFSEGDSQKTATAQKVIINGVIGLIIISLSVLIFNFVVTRILQVPLSLFDFNF